MKPLKDTNLGKFLSSNGLGNFVPGFGTRWVCKPRIDTEKHGPACPDFATLNSGHERGTHGRNPGLGQEVRIILKTMTKTCIQIAFIRVHPCPPWPKKYFTQP
jgi:hypothetical protein